MIRSTIYYIYIIYIYFVEPLDNPLLKIDFHIFEYSTKLLAAFTRFTLVNFDFHIHEREYNYATKS